MTPEDKLKAAVDKLDDAVKELTDVVLGVVLETVADEAEQAESCPSCRSDNPNVVGVEVATNTSCLDSFHCPSPQFHSNPFRYCPHCNWREEQ